MKLQTVSSVLASIHLVSGLSVPALGSPKEPEPFPWVSDTRGLHDRSTKIQVAVSSGTVIGSSLGNIESFRGIPFADPPIGSLRLRPPQRLSKPLGTFDASGLVAASCSQLSISTAEYSIITNFLTDVQSLPFLQKLTGQEDCLTINIQRPSNTRDDAKLPVFFWIFGGGFQTGGTSTYDGISLLGTAINQEQPFILVTVNYRLGGFGFLPGAEVFKDGSANLGLLDQRLALEWVADNIASFGGNPDKVTLWGQSAGAISVLDQMVLFGGNATYKGKSLFRGAIMNSGSITPTSRVDSKKAQAIYDTVVATSGCSGAPDTLNCLRGLDYNEFLKAANSVPGQVSYNAAALSYLPRPDGIVLPDTPDQLIAQGKYHAVPIIIGDQEDEATAFALLQPNLTKTNDLVDYFSSLYFHDASKAQLTELVNTYSSSVSKGSPFRTGIFNEVFPGFKRRAAILGDIVFTLARRAFLQTASKVNPDVPAWSYLASYNYGTPIQGTSHGSDILEIFYGLPPGNAVESIRTYYFNFLYNLDPNKGVTKYANWPKWNDDKKLMWFKSDVNGLLDDDFRQSSFEWLAGNMNILQV